MYPDVGLVISFHRHLAKRFAHLHNGIVEDGRESLVVVKSFDCLPDEVKT